MQKFCAVRKLVCKQSLTAGYMNQDSNVVVGSSSIWAVVSEERIAPLMVRSVEAFWGFDREGRLLDIWVWSTIDAP